jgi:hypothetical protein
MNNKTIIDIKKILEKLKKDRPVFHSEADFQHALAWVIHQMYPRFHIRLEKREILNKKEEVYFDILVFNKRKRIAIEVKYKTKEFTYTDRKKNEKFHLKNQGAQNLARYDFINDVSRLEKYVKGNPDKFGIAIFLTNDKSYWEEPKHKNTKDKNFRIHDGRILQGRLGWSKK